MSETPVSTVCAWSPYDCHEMPGTFETSCDNVFSFTEEGINENQFKFCPYCGGSINEIVLDKADD